MANVLKTESETIVGEDEFKLPIVECPEIKPTYLRNDHDDDKQPGKYWYICPECKNVCWREVNGNTYYHLRSCFKSNGIGYGEERSAETVNKRLALARGGNK